MIGKRIKELREEKGLSQKELSKIIGVSQQTIGSWETERTSPDPAVISKIADLFSTSTDYLLGRTDERNPGSNIETKAYHSINANGLSDEEIKQVEDFIDFLKKKYHPDGSLKK